MWAPKICCPRDSATAQERPMCLGQHALPKAKLRHWSYPTKPIAKVCNTNLNLIAATVTPGKHPALVVDRATWHVTEKLLNPDILSILPLPPDSPEPNSVEQIWRLRQSYWVNQCIKNYDDIVDACCQAWNTFASNPDTIRNLRTRKWF